MLLRKISWASIKFGKMKPLGQKMLVRRCGTGSQTRIPRVHEPRRTRGHPPRLLDHLDGVPLSIVPQSVWRPEERPALELAQVAGARIARDRATLL